MSVDRYLREDGSTFYTLEGSGGVFLLESSTQAANELVLDFIDEDAIYEPVMTSGPSVAITLDFIDEDAMYEPTMTLDSAGGITLDFIDEDVIYMITLGTPIELEDGSGFLSAEADNPEDEEFLVIEFMSPTIYYDLDFIEEDELWELDVRIPTATTGPGRDPEAERYYGSWGGPEQRGRPKPRSGGTTIRGPKRR